MHYSLKFKENLELILNLLECPNCHYSPLTIKEEPNQISLYCPLCKKFFSSYQGILDFTFNKNASKIWIANKKEARVYDKYFSKSKLRPLYTGYLFQDEVNQRLSLFNLPQEKKILDIGCGTCNYTLEFAKRTKDIVIGLDISFPILQICRKKVLEKGLENVFLIKADARDLPFRKESFTKIHHGALHFIQPTFSTYENLYSLLVPNGILCGAALFSSNSIFEQEVQFLFRKIFHANFLDPKVLTENLKKAGFVDIKLDILRWSGGFRAQKPFKNYEH